MQQNMISQRWLALTAIAIAAIITLPNSAQEFGDFRDFFDAPWIGYDTAVYPEGIGPVAAAVADFNADTWPDLATVSSGGSGHLSILMADGIGGYLPPVTYQLTEESSDLAAVDVDNDGDIDVIVLDSERFGGGDSISVWQNDGLGNFDLTDTFDTGMTGLNQLTTADYDNDGDFDVAVTLGNSAGIMLNTGKGGFAIAQTLTLTSSTSDIDSGDLDGDGDIDIIVAHHANRWTVLENIDGFFIEQSAITGVAQTVHIVDIDNDTDNDVIFASAGDGNFGDGGVDLWLNDGSGSFTGPQTISFGSDTGVSVHINTADVTGDGWVDIMAATGNAGDWWLVRSDGSGGFQAAQRLSAGASPSHIQTTDLNNDGERDVIVIATDSLEACVYLNPGSGAFVQPPVIDMVDLGISPAFTTNLQAADFDNDNDLDMVIGYRSDFEESFGISLRKNNGDGTFAAIEEYPDATYPIDIRAADIDNDGDVDVVYVNSVGRFFVLDNDGSGNFTRLGFHTFSSPTGFLKLADINNDDLLDVVFSTGFGLDVSYNTGNQTYQAPFGVNLPFGSGYVDFGDFDGDGNLDLLTSTGPQATAQVSMGNGDGTFEPPFNANTGRDIHAFATGFVDDDNDLDFVAFYNLDEKGISSKRGRGNGDFFPTENFHGSYDRTDHTSSLLLPDIDGDGNLDAMTANYGSRDVSVWEGNGDGSFQNHIRFGVGHRAKDLVYGDFDGDNIGDIMVIVRRPNGRWWYPAAVLLRGVDPDANAGESAGLVAVSAQFGNIVSGNLGAIESSDDIDLIATSQFGFLSSEPNVIDLRIAADSADLQPSVIDLALEARLNNPGGDVKVRLQNWNTNTLELVHSYTLGTTEMHESISVMNADRYVRDNDGRIEISVKSVVIATFSLSGFQAEVDYIDIITR